MSSTQVRIDLPSFYGVDIPADHEFAARYAAAARQVAVVFLVKNTSAAQVRYLSDLGANVIYGTDAPDVRLVTKREDRVLRRAALRSARLIHGGALAAK